MRKVKVVDTSLEAYRSLDPIRVSQTMQKIADTLKVIGTGNYEQISEASGMAEDKVWKRLIDCVRAGLIHRTDQTKITKKGCKSYKFAPGPATQIVKKRERVMKGKTVAQFSKDILSIHGQERLF